MDQRYCSDLSLTISINREANQCQYVSLGVQLEGRTCIQLEKYYNKCVQLGMMFQSFVPEYIARTWRLLQVQFNILHGYYTTLL